jgi:ATP-dependent DNA helicase RecG
MKKELFDFLSTDLQFTKGVGPVIAARLDELLGGRRVLDFMLHIPRAVKNRPPIEDVRTAEADDIVTIPLEIKNVKRAGISGFSRRRIPTRVYGYDKLGNPVILQFFGASFLDYWLNKLPVGSTRMVSGKLERAGEKFIINHPDFIEPMETASRIPEFQAIYRLSNGLTQRIMANIRDAIFSKTPEGGRILELLRRAHYPNSSSDLSPENETIRRLAYDELLAGQIAIALSRKNRIANTKRRPQREKISDNADRLKTVIPYELTEAQRRVMDEIKSDLAKPAQMMRLVQGDVGSGKTIVALWAMLLSLDFGGQACLLAPTDALAAQHFATVKPLCDKLGLVCEILTGRDKGKPRHEKLVSLKSGRAKLAIGTHALFSEDVEYKNLALAVIDEQHRFGVAERAKMASKGEFVDILALSATPIPRTLSMTIYGDMDISIINEKPKGRLDIITTKLPISQTQRLIERMKRLLANGAQAFWICPLVEESEASDMMNTKKRYDELRLRFKTGLVHGQMDKSERDRAMADFKNGKTEILVATSVIEVGIDVPNASIMVIENAERFGMSALHQMRGRVGRGKAQSYCVLLHGPALSENATKRLAALCETNDGFALAEQDLMMRGTGEILGPKQSGWLDYRFVDFREHRTLFKFAVDKAKEYASMTPIPEEARDLMWIFGQAEKMDFIKG